MITILISGPQGSGKTTIGKLIFNTIVEYQKLDVKPNIGNHVLHIKDDLPIPKKRGVDIMIIEKQVE